MTSAQSIDAFLENPAIAVVGVSRTRKGFGYFAWRTLRDKGYRAYAINPAVTNIDDERCYRGFDDLPELVSAALVVVPRDEAVKVVATAATAGVRHIWLQQGAESPNAIRLAATLGLNVVAGECILMFARPSGFHAAHRWIRRITHRLPAAASTTA
jgi:uncharacterized protein